MPLENDSPPSAEEARQNVRDVEERFSPFTPEEKAECREIAEKYYWKFNDIQFHPSGVRVISEDQGGWPFEAFVVNIAADPEEVRRCCLAALRALGGK
jgi:hypothetical protein